MKVRYLAEEFMTVFVFVLGVCAAVAIPLFLLSLLWSATVSKRECEAHGEFTGLQVKYDIFAGCYVRRHSDENYVKLKRK